MGVHGLWRLIDPSGKPVPFETLENKVLAVDISLWLHQAVKGFQDSRGAAIPNAHLLGIYHRVCKLLYFRIKPIFVFDGGVPVLKKQTIAKRNQQKTKTIKEADTIQKQLLNTLLKHTVVSNLLKEKIESIETGPSAPKKKDTMFALKGDEDLDNTFSSSDEDLDETIESKTSRQWDLHTIDMKSDQFKSLPVDVRHEILTDLKETRKQSSWGRIHEIPKISDEFSTYQMNRLLKRQAVQTALEDAEKEMGGKTLSLVELESILKDQGVIVNEKVGSVIASDEHTKYLLLKGPGISETVENTKKEDELKTVEEDTSKANIIIEEIVEERVEETKTVAEIKETKTIADVEFEEDLQAAIALSLMDEPSNSAASNETKPKSFIEKFADGDFLSSSSEDEAPAPTNNISSAQNYMKEYSGLTPIEIEKFFESKKSKPKLDSVKEVAKRVENENIDIVLNPKEDFSENDDLFGDIFKSDVVDNKDDVDAVEVMSSSSDSSDLLELETITPIPLEKEESTKNEELEGSKIQPATVVVEETNNIKELKKQSISAKNQVDDKQRTEKLNELKSQLQKESANLLHERGSKERIAGNITDQMYQEAQDLLELFGVPYIIAPMEAEAQCAFLDEINLTDGTITDDSDIWLFGGKTVYKNFFNQNKYVMEFKTENITHHFKLNREQMILLALLVGSDYTVGLQGVGPVTALEILAAFPPVNVKRLTSMDLISGLKEFRSWFTKGKSPGPGRRALSCKLKNLTFGESFPCPQVVQAYLEPKVETSREAFSWGKPDFGALVEFAEEKFGWTKVKASQILDPVLARMKDVRVQKSIKDFFKTTYKIQPHNIEHQMSKRVKSAINNMGKDPSERLKDELETNIKRINKPRKPPQKKQVTKYFPDDAPSTSQEAFETPPNDDIATKINVIRKRRQLKTSQNQIKNTTEKTAPKKKKPKKTTLETIPEELKEDEDVNMLVQTTILSEIRQEQITKELKETLENLKKNKPSVSKLRIPAFRKEVIPQKKQRQAAVLQSKLKAIETFRKSRRGPGYVPKKQKKTRLPKDDAGLSESSSDE